jgi:hypothetical protein
MKRCGMCNRVYADESLSFCLEDGTPLVRDSGGQFDAQATLVQPNVNTAPQRPPQTSPAPASQPQWSQANQPQFKSAQQPKRNLLPWLIGAVVLLPVLLGFLTGVVVFIYKAANKSSESSANVRRSVVSNTSNSNRTSNNSNGSAMNLKAREGVYTGTATNTTNSPVSTGDAEVEITDTSDLTGSMKMRMKFTNGLCGAGESFGVIDKSTGETSLFGSLTSGGTGCAEATWIMTTQCTFPGTDSLNCTYRLTSVGQATQTGKFEVSKQ